MEVFQTVGAFCGLLAVFLIGPVFFLERAVRQIIDYLEREDAESEFED